MTNSVEISDTFIAKESKKRAVFIISLIVIVLILFSSEYLYFLFQDGITIEGPTTIDRVLGNEITYGANFFITLAIVALFIQFRKLLKTSNLLEISEKGILYEGNLYTWDNITNYEVQLGVKDFDVSLSLSRKVKSHRLSFRYLNEKISIKLNSLDKSPEEIDAALYQYAELYSKRVKSVR